MANNYDFTSNMNYMLNNTLSSTIEDNIVLQDLILNSDSFNTTFKYIEDSLNLLYEKTRTLEDIVAYSKTFLANEINNSISDCKTLLQSIEEDKNLIKDKTYIKYSVPFLFGLNAIPDRNYTKLNSAVVYDSKLSLADNVFSNYDISYFSIKRDNASLYNNESNYLNSKNYRTLYISNSIRSSSIQETITIKFNNAVKMNKLNVNLSNCKITAVQLMLENNKTMDLDIDKLKLFNTQYVNSIAITIACSNYSVSQTSYSNITADNFISIISNINTDTNTTVNATKYYYYLFGVDAITAQYVSVYDTCGFISKDVYIGSLKSNEHLTLYTEESIERGSIEYSLINGTEVIPILPENQTQVIDEQIFYKYPTRFTIDSTYDVIVKLNGEVVNTSLYDAINTNTTGYTVTYTPVINTISSLLNSNVKVKVVLRSYDTDFTSFVKTIKIKKYGGNSLWTV
jgi:hypothetical protein